MENKSAVSLSPNPNLLNAVVEARGLTKVYGKQRAVDAIDFSVKRSETFGLLGPNGAGKSTTMRMIACRTPLTSGELLVESLDVRTHGREIRSRIGVVPAISAPVRPISASGSVPSPLRRISTGSFASTSRHLHGSQRGGSRCLPSMRFARWPNILSARSAMRPSPSW